MLGPCWRCCAQGAEIFVLHQGGRQNSLSDAADSLGYHFGSLRALLISIEQRLLKEQLSFSFQEVSW